MRIDQIGPNSVRLTHAAPPEGRFRAVVTNEFGMASREVQVLVEFPGGGGGGLPFMRRGTADTAAESDIATGFDFD